MTQPDLFAAPAFEPTLHAAHARLAAVNPAAYSRTRNHLDGAVTRLSPYLTHGFLTLPEVLHGVLQRHPLDVQHKFVFELGWREYFHHVWQQEGDAIFASLHEGPLPDA
ncbi:MAG TPA: deoxyribodipyrimidine photolyase, partial [Rubrivivax sp.]|nr:deoxyribodipyrimidine photolyase [Rubrivivax sp.]